MKRIFVLSLLTLIATGGVVHFSTVARQAPNAEIAAAPATNPTKQGRDVFYLNEQFGFRMSLPYGYVITPSAIKPEAKPTPPIQVIELWQQADYLNQPQLTETPPIIRIAVYKNSQKLPLTTWKGDLSRNDDRPLTIADQTAIAYTSTGLYESDNVLFRSPDGQYVFRLTVGYLVANDAIRQTFQEILSSFMFDVLPDPKAPSKKRINYSRLQKLLEAKNWQAADVETRAIFQRLVGPKGGLLFDSKKVLANIPLTDLQTLDQLWSKASQGRFGFRAQQKIWQQTTKNSKNPKVQVEQFAKKVGWLRSQPLPENHPLNLGLGSLWRFDKELNYTAIAPVGHLPWMGISSSHLTDMLNERSLGCGSCTIDAMYLANDRFYDYLPTFFTKFK